MNEFDVKRFAKVLRKDCRSTVRRYGGARIFLVMVVPTLVAWVFSFGHTWDNSPDYRSVVTMVSVLSILTMQYQYGMVNTLRGGKDFALLPASHVEKGLSMFLVTLVVFPVICFVFSFMVDTLLTLLPFGPFDKFLWQEGGLDDDVLDSVLIFLMFGATFLYGNVLFSKHKMFWSLALVIGIGLVLTIFALLLRLTIDLVWETPPEIHVVWFTVLCLLYTALMVYLTCRKIKKLKY